MNEFHSNKYTKARKEHRCEFCEHPIEIGMRYARAAGIFEGDFYSYKTHAGCLWVMVVDAGCEGLQSSVVDALSNFDTFDIWDFRHILEKGWRSWLELPRIERARVKMYFLEMMRKTNSKIADDGDNNNCWNCRYCNFPRQSFCRKLTLDEDTDKPILDWIHETHGEPETSMPDVGVTGCPGWEQG